MFKSIGDGVPKVFIRNLNDFNVFQEVITHDHYQVCKLIPLLKRVYRNYKGVAHPPVIFDFGGHIGTFAALAHQLWPEAQVHTFEVLTKNIYMLELSVGDFANIHHCAVTYETDVVLADATKSGFFGGSIVRPRLPGGEPNPNIYDERALDCPCVTVEELVKKHGVPALIKMDMEGSEISIFQKSTSITQVPLIVGEYHDRTPGIFKRSIEGKLTESIIGIERGLDPNIGRFHAWKIV